MNDSNVPQIIPASTTKGHPASLQKRDKLIMLRLSPDEVSAIVAAATMCGLSKTEFIRTVILQKVGKVKPV